jgi:tetratricopeptide (TPR) repeat protein
MNMRYFHSLLLLILLLITPALSLAVVDPLTMAKEASAAGEYERAIRWYDETLAQDPQDQEALFGKIQALSGLSRWEEVLNTIAGSGIDLSENQNIAILQAEGLVKTGRPDEAIPLLDASSGWDQKDVIRIRSEALLAQGKGTEAQTLLKKAETDGIEDPRLALLAGTILTRQGNVSASLPYLEKAYLGLSNNPETSASLGQAAATMGMHEEALIFYQEAADIDPSNVEIRVTIAFLLSKLGRYDEALQILEEPLALHPTDSTLLNAKAYILFLAGRGVEGRTIAEEALRQLPDDPGVMDTLGSILLAEGSVEEALRYLEQAAGISEDPEILTHLGEAYHRSGDDTKAQDIYQKSLRLDSTSGQAWRGYSEVLLSLKRYPEAAAAIQEAFTYYPGDKELIAMEKEADEILLGWYIKREEAKNATPFR